MAATTQVLAARDTFQRTDSNNGEKLQTAPTESRSAYRFKSEIENEMYEESTSVATLGRKGVGEGKAATARESVFLKRLVIALIIMVMLLSIIVLSLVIVIVKDKSGESDETGTETQQGPSTEKLQGAVPDTDALIRLNNLEENMKSLKQNLEEKTKDIILPRCFLRYFDAKCKESEELALKIQNIRQRLDASVIAINGRVQNISKVQGPPGAPGFNGSKGETGPPGAKGTQGYQGVPGNKGDKGDPGINGANGNAGEKGDKGIPGNKGEPGVRGDPGVNGPQGPPGLKGSNGETGPPGAKGTQGDQGVQGHKGVKGDPGVNGADGNTGQKGDKGDKGEPGVKGEPGGAGSPGPDHGGRSL